MIFIDAGHGGIDPITKRYTTAGKAFDHQKGTFHDKGMFYEGVFNRSCAEALKRICKSVDLPSYNVYHPFKDLPMHQRTALANDFWVKANRVGGLASFHGNASGNWSNAAEQAKTGKRPARGFSVWTSIGETSSDKWAQYLVEELREGLKLFGMPLLEHKQDGDSDFEANFWMLTKTACPAILLESGFFDSYEDAQIMIKPEFQEMIAKAVFNAYLQWRS